MPRKAAGTTTTTTKKKTSKLNNVHPSRAANILVEEAETVPMFASPSPISTHSNPFVNQLSGMSAHEINMMSGMACDCKECLLGCVRQFEVPRKIVNRADLDLRMKRLYGFATYYLDHFTGRSSGWKEKEKQTWNRWLRETSVRIQHNSLRMDEALVLFSINPEFQSDIIKLNNTIEPVCSLGGSPPMRNLNSPEPYVNPASP